jgi:DNA-binding NarL/FixJ family response regulator
MSDRILVIGDDAFEISTLASALRMYGIDVIGETKSESAARNMLRRLQPDVVVLDMKNIGKSAVKIAMNLRIDNPDIGIVILSSCSDLRFIGEVNSDVPAGSKVLIKNSLVDFSVLCTAISDSKKSGLEKHAASWINGNVSLQNKDVSTLMAHLTDTQAETLRLVADGMTNAQIGRTRYVSEKSVEQVISRVAQELNVQPNHNMNMRVQLVSEYYRLIGAPTH